MSAYSNHNMLVIKKENNKLLYGIDLFFKKSVSLVLGICLRVLPTKLYLIISKLEQHSSALHNAVGLTFFNAIGGVLLFVTQVKLANEMGASVYRVYSYWLAIGEVGAMFVRYGRNKTMTRDLIQISHHRSQLISNTFILGWCNLLLFIVIILSCHKLLHVDLSLAFLLLIVSPCLISLDFQPVYESHNLMSWHSIYYLLQKGIFLLFVWGIMLLLKRIFLLEVGIALFVSWVMILFLQYKEIVIQLNIRVLKSFSFKELTKLYKTNFLIALSCMFGIAFGPLIRLILNNYVDSKAVGIYSAGLQIFLMAQFVLNQIGRVGNPMMAVIGKQNYNVYQRRIFVKRYLGIMLVCVIPFFIVLFCFSHWITVSFFTPEYRDLEQILPIFACYLLLLSIGVVYTQFLISMRKDKVYFLIYILTALATIPTALILIPHYGVVGATLALCVPHGVGCLCYFFFSRKYLTKKQ